MSWIDLVDFFSKHWGNLASVLGLVVSLATLAVAGKARDAAEAARVTGSRSNLSTCQELAGSISEVVLVASSSPPNAGQVTRMSQAQNRVGQLLNTELGGALRGAEGSR